jgi:virginiamycin B lyase
MRAWIANRAVICATFALASTAAPAAAVQTEYPLPEGTAAAVPSGIAAGPDGAVWFTERARGAIGRIAADGSVQEFPLPTSVAEPASAKKPTDIVAGPDGALWFTQSGVDRIGRITTAGAITEYGSITPGGQPGDIAVGPDGKLWFTEYGYNRGNRIGLIDPATGAVSEFCIRTCNMPELPSDYGLRPRDIAAGPDGRMWFAIENPEQNQNPYGDTGTGYIGAIDAAGSVAQFQLPTAHSRPIGVAAGPDGNVWFTEYGGNKVGRVTPAGEITEFALPTPGSGPADITTGPDQNLWFTQWDGNRLGRITPDGSITDSPAVSETFSTPNRIAVGPDEALWFTESGTDKIGRQTADAAPIVKLAGVRDAGADTATIFGSVNPSGASSSYLVRYGFTTDFGSTSPEQDAGAGRDAVDIAVVLKELEPSSIYYYRLEASNSQGTTRSSIGTFTTSPPHFEYPPPEPLPPAEPPPPPPPPPRPDAVRLKVLRVDPEKRPRRFMAKGRLAPPRDKVLVDPCLEGLITLTVRQRKVVVKRRRVGKRTVRRKIVKWTRAYQKTTALEENCTYRTRFKLRRDVAPAGRYRVVARFIGNEAMSPKRSKPRRIQIVRPPRKKNPKPPADRRRPGTRAG